MMATTSPINTPYFEFIAEILHEMYPGANLVPVLGIGSTDMRYYRKKGVTCYGFSLLVKDKDLSYGELLAMSHAPNERISVTNLMLATEFAYRAMRRV